MNDKKKPEFNPVKYAGKEETPMHYFGEPTKPANLVAGAARAWDAAMQIHATGKCVEPRCAGDCGGMDPVRFIAAKLAPNGNGYGDRTKHETITTFQGRQVGVVMGATTDSRTLTGINREPYNDPIPLSLATPDWLENLYLIFLGAKGVRRETYETTENPITLNEVPDVLRYLARCRVPMPSDPKKTLPRHNRAQIAAIAAAIKTGDYRRPRSILRGDDKRTIRKAHKAAGIATDKRPRIQHNGNAAPQVVKQDAAYAATKAGRFARLAYAPKPTRTSTEALAEASVRSQLARRLVAPKAKAPADPAKATAYATMEANHAARVDRAATRETYLAPYRAAFDANPTEANRTASAAARIEAFTKWPL